MNGVDLPGWAQVFLGVIGGLALAAIGGVKWAFTINSRIQKLENQDIRGIIRDELARERHDVLYPQLQIQVYAVLDKIEEEQKKQGQNIAVLLEKDRTADALKSISDNLNAILSQVMQRRLEGP